MNKPLHSICSEAYDGCGNVKRRYFLGVLVSCAGCLVVTSAFGAKYKTINAKSIKEGDKDLPREGKHSVVDVQKLRIVKLDLRGLPGKSVLLKFGSKKIPLDTWKARSNIPKGGQSIMIAARAADFPGASKELVSRLEALGENETLSWTSGDTMVGDYGCTDIGYWCQIG